MAKSRKPKKVLIQMGIALVVALVLGIGGVFTVFGIIQMINANTEAQYADKLKEKDRLEQEKTRLEAKNRELQDAARNRYTEVQAIRDITAGEPLTKDMVELFNVDQKPDMESMTRLSDVVGKIATGNFITGEVISRNKLARTDGLVQIEDGKRAITIGVSGTGSINGAVNPGAVVDVLTTVKDKDSTEITKTLMQGVKVLAVGGGGGNARGGAQTSSVTLSVTPREAELLTLADNVGKFHLTLRNFKDTRNSKVGGVDMVQLLTGQKTAGAKTAMPKAPEMPPVFDGMHNVNYDGGALPAPGGPGYGGQTGHSMEIYRGSGSEKVVFD